MAALKEALRLDTLDEEREVGTSVPTERWEQSTSA